MMNQIALMILAGIAVLFLVFWIFHKPHIGIAFTVASLPIVDLLPDIPYLPSVVPLVGGLTFVAYLMGNRENPKRRGLQLSSLHIVSLIFIAWVLFSNPQAALFGEGRNWLLTLVQLWILLFLSGELLTTPQKQHTVMIIFSIFGIISAFYAIESGFIGETVDTSVRAGGFVDNANAAARYFVIAMIFLSYFRSITTTKPFLRILTLVGIIITYLGVFYTVSRTGMLLLFGALGLILFFQMKGRQRIGIIFIFLIGLVILWFLAENIFGIIESILPIIVNREDTFGLRLNLWHSAWLMWLDHPIRGVGIGKYIDNVGPYMYQMEGPRVWSAVTHNTYFQVLSETGIIGFGLFMSMFGITLRNFIKSETKGDTSRLTLRNTWLIAFIVILVGGITKSDHIDKFSWMVMGLSLNYYLQTPASQESKNDQTRVEIDADDKEPSVI